MENMTPVETADTIAREKTLEELEALKTADAGGRYVSELDKERARAREAGDFQPVLIQIQSNPLGAAVVDWSLDPKAGKQYLVFHTEKEAKAEAKRRLLFHKERGAVVFLQVIVTERYT